MGFTLIELLVVCAMIGVLAAIVILNVSFAKGKSRDSKRAADVGKIKTAMELFYNDNDRYINCTPNASGTGSYRLCSGATGYTAGYSELSPYMAELPKDPLDSKYYEIAEEGTGESAVNPQKYGIWVRFEKTGTHGCATGNDNAPGRCACKTGKDMNGWWSDTSGHSNPDCYDM